MFNKKKESKLNIHHRKVDVEKLMDLNKRNTSATRNKPVIDEQMVAESPDPITGLCRHILHVKGITPDDIYKGCMRHYGANAKQAAGNKYNNVLRLLKDTNSSVTTSNFFTVISDILGLRISDIGISTIDSDTGETSEYVLQLINTSSDEDE